MINVSNAERVVFPAIGRTKGEVVAYYARIAPLMLEHVRARPITMRRFPKGLAAPGFFQKNVPAHYPASIARCDIPRSRDASKKHGEAASDVTVYPVLSDEEHLAYLANQGAIELHVPTTRASDLHHPDRLIIDLDPPEREVALVRRAAAVTRDALAGYGLACVPVATGSKGYHLVAPIVPNVPVETLAESAQMFAALLAAEHSELLTDAFRIALRGRRVFLDWLRNNPVAHGIAPYSLRARERANVAVPLTWEELDHVAPDAFTIADVERLRERDDPLTKRAAAPGDARAFVQGVREAFERAGLVLEVFDRFR